MSDEPELRSCPFCGGDAYLVWCKGRLYMVECELCHATSARFISPQEAIEAWNGRVANA